MILAKHQGIVVRLYPQPQQGRLPSVSGTAVVRGRWCKHRPLAACLGVVQAVTLHPSGALTPLRHAAGTSEGKITDSGAQPRPSRAVRARRLRGAPLGHNPSPDNPRRPGFVTSVTATRTYELSLAAS